MADTFNGRLALLLQQKDMTQKELAVRAGVTEAAMSHYIKGDRTPRASVITRIAEALGTTVDKGTDLLKKFTPTEEFSEDWEGAFRGECSREIIKVKA